MGDVTDEKQISVALTRGRRGLIIIGKVHAKTKPLIIYIYIYIYIYTKSELLLIDDFKMDMIKNDYHVGTELFLNLSANSVIPLITQLTRFDTYVN